MTKRQSIDYLGALEPKRLVNRTEALKRIKKAIDEPCRSYVFYITGPGGTGKTMLLRDVLRRCREKGEWSGGSAKLAAAEDVVDFYHADTHSMGGLMRAIWDVLGPERAALTGFSYKMGRFEREKYHLAGMLRELSTLQDEAAKAFLEDLNRLTGKHRLVLALDTAEKLVYETDRVQEVLGLAEEGVAARPWLVRELLPMLENAVVLLAGRPSDSPLLADLKQALSDRLIELRLPGFETREDAVDYFDAVAEVVRAGGRHDVAERIAAVPETTREVAWRYTGGRPILMSLMINYLVVADRLLPDVTDSVKTARRKSGEALKHTQERIEVELVRSLQDRGSPLDEAVRALAWARKGMDAELLALVANMETDRAEELLNDLRQLSFVKERPADQRVFLHDELYSMLERHVLSRLPEQRRNAVLEAILAYYEEHIAKARARVDELRPHEYEEEREGPLSIGEPRPPADAEAQIRATARLYSLMVDETYYRLRRSPADGYRSYLTYRQEAFWTAEDSLDMQLRDEMLDYLRQNVDREQLDGLTRSEVQLDEAFSWVDRMLRRTKHKTAVDLLLRLRQTCADLIEQGGLLAQAQLNSLDGRSLAYYGENLDRSRQLLDEAIANSESMEPQNPFDSWRRDILQADALNTLGYLYRTTGRYQQAIIEYQRALPLWRSLIEREKVTTLRDGLGAQYANTLNNLSWAQASVGQYQQALRTCRDALEMRQRLGPMAPTAFSLNTMGLIHIKADHPHRARVNCEQALAIFRDLQQPRGVGLARIALAEAHRRMSSSVPGLYAPKQVEEQLKSAEASAGEAVDIFTRQVPELPQLVEALIEWGCTCRDWAYILTGRGKDADRIALARKGEDALRQAMREGAGEPRLLHMVVDAQVNLAWLYDYMDQHEKAKGELKAALERVPSEYHIVRKGGVQDSKLPQTFLWVLLGKAELLYAEMAMDEFRDSAQSEHLIEAARHYTLSLSYDALFARDFRDLRRAEERIYDRVKRLNEKELGMLWSAVDLAADEYALEKPTRMHSFMLHSLGSRPSIAEGT